jgi:uncharacterized protein YqgC (DUF456 family)
MNKILAEMENGFSLLFGAAFIVIGIVGLFLPIIPGILLIVFGLYLIGGKHLVNKVRNSLKFCSKK